MKKLLEAINKGVLKGLSESNINLLTDLDDSDLDQLDSIQTKSVNNNISVYKYFPKTKEELVEIIKAEVERKGWNCSLNHIDTSRITDMSYLFSGNRYYGYDLEEFNGDISRWNVSNVKDMRCMFLDAESFNQPIGDWDVSNVKDMRCMFKCAESFNQPIGDWDVSKVTTMESMFDGAYLFNQPIGDWNISNVTDMRWMFYEAESFNQDLSSWQLKHNFGTDYIVDKCPIKGEYKPKVI